MLDSEKSHLLDAFVPGHASRTANSMTEPINLVVGGFVQVWISIPFDFPEFSARA